MKYRTLLLVCMLTLGLSGAVSEDPRAERATHIRDNATITFTGRYTVACPPALVEVALNNPLIMGALWTSYQYTPHYKVSGLDEPGAVHVKDPTGLVGDVWSLRGQGSRVAYLAEGTVDHWAVPVLNGGTAVFDVEVAAMGSGTQVTVTVSMLPESRIARAALWTLSSFVKARIESRVTHNFQDAARILEAIATAPDRVAERLQGNTRRAFERVFL